MLVVVSVHAFPSTRWSRVLAANSSTPREAAAGLEYLCNAYADPLRAFARSRGFAEADAEDLVQSFVLTLLGGGRLSGVDKERGRFRSYLLGAFRHHVSNLRRRDAAQKRGGGAVHVDFEETRHSSDAAGNEAEMRFHAAWIETLLHRAASKVRGDYERRGQQDEFDRLESALTRLDLDYASLSEELGKSEGAVRVAMHRLRTRMGLALRAEIAETVVDPDEIDAELRSLLERLPK